MVKMLQAIDRTARAWWKSIRTVRLRPHRSTLVLLLPVLTVLVLANWPGWKVAQIEQLHHFAGQPFLDSHYEHGWPLTYLRRSTWVSAPKTGDFSNSPWKLKEGVLAFHVIPLLGDLVVGIAVLIVAGVAVEVRRRWQNSFFQYRLFELLILVTVAAVGLSFYAVRRKEYREERETYEWLHREDSAGSSVWNDSDWLVEGPDWLLSVIGEDLYRELFVRVRAVETGGSDLKEAVKLRHLLWLRLTDSSTEQLAPLVQMPKLEGIEFMSFGEDQEVELPPLPRLRVATVDDPHGSFDSLPNWRIKGLSALKSLECLHLRDDQFDDESMVQLEGMKHLHWLWIDSNKDQFDDRSRITSAGIRHLRGATELDWLILAGTHVDDAAMPIIGRMKSLACLDLSDTRISDAGLEPIRALENLHDLYIENTTISAGAVRRLKESLPKCRIMWSLRSPKSEAMER